MITKSTFPEVVTACYNHLSLGSLHPSLVCAEKWCAKYYGLQIGGKATEAAFDALRRFGLSVEEIQRPFISK
jgi:hypothetical protein